MRILNRALKWGMDAITYEGDEKHVATFVDELRFGQNTKGFDVPLPQLYDAVKDEDEELDHETARWYQRLAATINFISMCRPDLQFIASVLGRTMARPTARVRRQVFEEPPGCDVCFSPGRHQRGAGSGGVFGQR